jgi:hypothetical protein
MTLALILISSIIVWLNRGQYDPSVPVLVAFFLAWAYSTFTNRSWLSQANRYLFLLPWIFALLFIFRNDLLYVDSTKKEALALLRFFPLLSVAIYTLDQKVYRAHPRAVRSLPMFFIILILIPFISPDPHIDVFQSNKLAVDFFLKGINPYSAIYPDIYHNQYDYHPGFLYWPGALLFQTFSQVVFHDIRIILIMSWIGAAFFLKSRKHYMIAWLTLPFLAFAFEQAWLDPLIAFGGALALYGLRTKKHLWWVVGVVIAATVKQYGFMIGLFSVLYFVLRNGIPKVRLSLLAMTTAFLVIMTPFILWDPNAFLNMTVFSHASAQIRPDALNFTAFWLKMTGQELAPVLQLGFILLGLFIGVFHVIQNHLRRGLRCVPEAWAIFFGFSVFFGKFAFCNYFLLLIAFWILAESEGEDYLLAKLDLVK